MTFQTLLRTAEKFVTDNSPGILTGLGVAGAVTTAVLAGKATWNSAVLVNEANQKEGIQDLWMSPKDKFELVWKEFIPAAAVGTVTIASIIMANSIGSRRAAAITAAFKLSEQLSEEYKDRVVKTLGLQKEEQMRSDLAGDKMRANPPSNLLVVAGSDVLMLDDLSGRYFTNQLENVRKAVNDINHKVNNYYSASLTDFYEMIGLSGTSFSDSIGWNTDELLEIQFSPTIYESKPAILISYNHNPTHGYDRVQ